MVLVSGSEMARTTKDLFPKAFRYPDRVFTSVILFIQVIRFPEATFIR